MTNKKVAAVDVDGVISDYRGWNKGIMYDDIVPGAKEGMQKLKDMGYYILIYSTRTNPTYRKPGEPDQYLQIEEYLKKYQIPYDKIYTGQGKPMSDFYIDDRAIPFRGDWAQTIEDVKNFKVWNRPDAKSSAELNNISLSDK